MHALTDHSQALLDSLLERTSDGHHLADRLHGATQLTVHAAELTQVPTRNLTYHIIQGWLEEGGSGLRHRVLQVEEAIAQAQLSRHEGQRITRRLTCQSGGAGQAGIHLDHPVILTHRIEGILHVALTHDTDVTDDLYGKRTQLMVLTVRERLRRSDDDGLTRMDTKRVEVLHVTYRDAIVEAVTHHLVLDLLPALQRFLHKHLRGEREGFLGQFIQLFLVVAEA